VGSVATKNGGGEHGHIGMVIDEAEYITFSNVGVRFLVPMNPGPYPATVDLDKVIRERKLRNTRWTVSNMKPALALKTTSSG
jgi:hypothetical protein